MNLYELNLIVKSTQSFFCRNWADNELLEDSTKMLSYINDKYIDFTESKWLICAYGYGTVLFSTIGHELGHAIMARACGLKVGKISIGPFFLDIVKSCSMVIQ